LKRCPATLKSGEIGGEQMSKRKIEEFGVKRLYVVIPEPLFRELQRLGYMGEIDSVITKLLYQDVEERKKGGGGK